MFLLYKIEVLASIIIEEIRILKIIKENVIRSIEENWVIDICLIYFIRFVLVIGIISINDAVNTHHDFFEVLISIIEHKGRRISSIYLLMRLEVYLTQRNVTFLL
jgi:hypothetical protein